jgi:hypothetical protein
MARVVAFVPDLLFGSRVQGDLRAAGHDVELVASAAALPAAVSGADALVVDLTADAAQRVQEIGDPGLPVLAFYSHVDVEVRDLARAAGFALVVPRSRMAREGGALVDGLLGSASGPGVE